MSHRTYPRTSLENYLDLKRGPRQHVSRRPTSPAERLVAEHDEIVFNPGTLEGATPMGFHDLVRTTEPALCRFSRSE